MGQVIGTKLDNRIKIAAITACVLIAVIFIYQQLSPSIDDCVVRLKKDKSVYFYLSSSTLINPIELDGDRNKNYGRLRISSSAMDKINEQLRVLVNTSSVGEPSDEVFSHFIDLDDKKIEVKEFSSCNALASYVKNPNNQKVYGNILFRHDDAGETEPQCKVGLELVRVGTSSNDHLFVVDKVSLINLLYADKKMSPPINRGECKDGLKDGLWTHYYDNSGAQKKSEGMYRMGKKIGKWKFWNNKGLLLNESMIEGSIDDQSLLRSQKHWMDTNATGANGGVVECGGLSAWDCWARTETLLWLSHYDDDEPDPKDIQHLVAEKMKGIPSRWTVRGLR